ncbi:hypothetical protein BZG36_01731 [Bifiguratus adelaidae]|uniref:Uncharacterized protein n=1 Tax=Bifiguratus adelaidae TaxID=1938954 RepID=A0A261Y3A3_9FUNG|nr:hypothetical protein BZG36_01731 [Bifiguratus adelaidae]
MERSATLTAGAAVDWDCAVQAEVKAAELANRRQFTGTLDGVMKIAKYEGITSLWRGLAPALVMSGPSTVIYFVGYDCAKEYLDRKWGNSQAWLQWSPLLVGAVARTVAATMISPIELFRTRLQSNEGINGFRGVLDGVVEMVRREGPTSLWRGLPSTLWRDVPFSAIYWMGYETIKRHLTRWTVDNHTHRFHLNDFEIAFLSGAGSGMIAATVTTPFDVAKTRRQVDTARLTGENVESVRSSKTADILRAVVQEEGYQGLFRGLIPRVAKVAPSCAIMISSYEFGKRFFARQTEVM